jgi:drug/metabolite transporter (DMT)-like permease
MTAPIDRRKAIIFLLLAAALWSTSGIFLKILNWQPIAVLGARSFFSGLVFLAYLRRIPRRFTRWQWVAALCSVLTQLLYITSIQMTTAANAIFLQYTAPLYILLLGYWFLREKPSRMDWVAMIIIFAGLGLFFGDSLSPGGLTGNILAIISGVTMAMMTVAMRAQKDGTPAESFLLANLLGTLLGGFFVFRQPWTASNWAVVIYLGIFQIGIAFLLYSQAIKVIPALEATLIGMLEPILNPVWVFFFIAETPGPMAFIGALVVLAGVVISSVASAKAE